MYKHLMKANENPELTQEIAAMRKDLTVPAEVAMRQRVASGMLLEYAKAKLQDGMSIEAVKQLILDEASKLSKDLYFPSTFAMLVMTDMASLFIEKTTVFNRIVNRVCAHKDTEKALKAFADPNISAAANTIKAGVESFAPSTLMDKTIGMYMSEICDVMSKRTNLDMTFFK